MPTTGNFIEGTAAKIAIICNDKITGGRIDNNSLEGCTIGENGTEIYGVKGVAIGFKLENLRSKEVGSENGITGSIIEVGGN